MPKLTFMLHNYKPLVRKVLSTPFYNPLGEGSPDSRTRRHRNMRNVQATRKVLAGTEMNSAFPIDILSFVSPLRNLSKISFKHFFYYFPRKKKEFKNDGLFLPEKICYRWACHTLFLGLMVDPQTLIVIGHWATHYLLLQLSYVCVCVCI